jgi:hypothetical protein
MEEWNMDRKNTSFLTRSYRNLGWAALFALPLTGLMAGKCQAGAVAIALNQISDFTVTGLPTLTFANISPISGDNATLYPFKPGVDFHYDYVNADPARLNTNLKDSYSALHMGDFFSYGDSQIIGKSTITNRDKTITYILPIKAAFNTIAEVHLNKTGDGTAMGEVSYAIKFNLAGPSTLDFSFKSSPDLYTSVTGGATITNFAIAKMMFGVGIINRETGLYVASWAPNGVFDPNGTTFESFSLNKSVNNVLGSFPDTIGYDPGSNGVFVWKPSIPKGNYLLDIVDKVEVDVQYEEAQKVPGNPEPSTLTLLGIGSFVLLGYGWRRRKRIAGRVNSPTE